MEQLKQIVAKNIAELRTACKLTQLELGREISYSDKAVSKWERGEAIPDALVLLKLSQIFGVTVDYILTEHGEEDAPKAVMKVSSANRLVVALIAITGIWALTALVYVILLLSGINHMLVFQYALNISAIVLTVMNTLWGKRIYNLICISLLVWSIIATVYLIFLNLSYDWWQLLMLGIPAQVIIGLCFVVKKDTRFYAKLKSIREKKKDIVD